MSMDFASRPVDGIISITPSTAALSAPVRAIWVGIAGDVRLTTPKGDTVTLANVTAGVWHPQYATHVLNTGTTASGGILGARL